MAQRWIATRFGSFDGLELIEEDVPVPQSGQVTIEVRAVGMNPTEYKGILGGTDSSLLPLSIGNELAGVITAIGPDTQIGSGGGAVGDEVLAYRVAGAYASALTVDAADVFAKPAQLSFAEAANLFLVGATAADMLRVVEPAQGDTVVVHGASSSVGVSLLQQLRPYGVRVLGTASEKNFDVVRRFGGEPFAYGTAGLQDQLAEAAGGPISAAYDNVGTDEALDVSLALVADRSRIVSIAGFARAAKDGFRMVGGSMPDSISFRAEVRPALVALAARGDLVVPVARTFPLAEAREALELLAGQHPGGKLALVP
jgi:NADPH:quinone reductase-like Zn-dependent oxidoreductase